MPVAREDTKYGALIEDHDWTEPESWDDGEPAASVDVHMHSLVVNHEPEESRYNGLQYWFLIDDGTITGVDKQHYCPGPGHTDPMDFVAWGDVPAAVRRTVLAELNAESADEVVDVEATEEVVRDGE